MKCLRCNTDNIAALAHCEKCGAPLRVRRQTDLFHKRKIVMVLLVLVCWVGGFTFFFRDILFWEKGSSQEFTDAERLELERERNEKRKELAERLKAIMANEQDVAGEQSTGDAIGEAVLQGEGADAVSEKEIIAGWTSIFDPWSRQVTRFRSAATASGWVAIPSRASLAGNKWVFYADYGRETQFEKGLWGAGDSVGLWRQSAAEAPAAAQLAAWNPNAPVDWISIESQRKQSELMLESVSQQAPFILCALPRDIDEIGVLVQNDSIVGWSFGQWLNDGYLWNGQPGAQLIPQVTVQSFYNDTFSGGREEKFAGALSLGESGHDVERLQTFIDGFRLEPKLSLVDTPYYLHPDEIAKQIRIIASQLLHGGKGATVASMLDSEILLVINDISLFMDIIPAITASSGYDLAIREIETTGRLIVEQIGLNVPALNELHVTLYQEWLQSLVTVSAVGDGFAVFEKAKSYYPEDPYIHLLGVELELLLNNWQKAEERLYARSYPPAYQDRFQLLAKRISELKGEEGKIVIRFAAGSSRIPVVAALNEAMYQDFLVDTGASLITIPSSTADSLRLQFVDGPHGGQHMVSTAGGNVAANEVMIEALEIDGWIEYNVRALVLDIPDQPGLGLLGLNYLSRFKMDLNTNEGVLLLSPR